MNLEEKIITLLKRRQKNLSAAESCTGGLISNRLTNVPGSSEAFVLGVIAYSNAAKVKILSIPEALIKEKGAVSSEVAEAMASNVRDIHGTNFGIGITGIAGPGGGSKRKPVGLVYIAVATELKTLSLKFKFQGSRLQIKQKAATQALKLLLEFLS
ncbi:MAG: CinA family protein [Candidatus Omnitrophota bacterium]